MMDLGAFISELRDSLEWDEFIKEMESENFVLKPKTDIAHIINDRKEISSGYVMYVDNQIESQTIHDASHLHLRPRIVFHPLNAEQLRVIIINCQKFSIPVTFAGGKTGLSGGYANYGIIVDLMDLSVGKNAISVDLSQNTIMADQNVLISDLIKEVEYRSKGKRIFPVQPSSAFKLPVTVGGITSTNASGVTSGKLGPTSEWILKMTVMLPEGEIIDIGPEDPSFNMFVGRNGYHGVVLRVSFKLHKTPADLTHSVLFGSDENQAFTALQKIQDNEIYTLTAEFVLSRTGLTGKFKNLGRHMGGTPNLENKWAVLIKGQESNVERVEKIMQDSADARFQRVTHEKFDEYLSERAAMALMSMSNVSGDDILRFPGFEDILIQPKYVPRVLEEIDEIVESHGFNRVFIGYGHLNFRKGRGCLMHARLPVLISGLVADKRRYLNKISRTIAEVVIRLRNRYNVRPKAEHSLGAFGIWLDGQIRDALRHDIGNNKAFYNPHLLLYEKVRDFLKERDEKDPEDVVLFNKLLRIYLRYGT